MMRLRRALHTVREATALAPTRPAYAAGIRAAIATVLPLVVAPMLPAANADVWMSLGGFNGALSDRGGPYRTRATTMGLITLSSAVAVALGTLAGGHDVIAVALTFVVALVACLFRTFGDAGASIGGATLSTFVIALAIPAATVTAALTSAGFAIVGGLWAMTIALLLWPLRPYRPGRVAVANAYRVFADYVDDVARGAARPASGADDDAAGPPGGSAAMRAALENVRHVLAQLRRGRSGTAGRGERLLVIGEAVDQIFGHVVALAETVATIPPDECDAAAQAAVADALAAMAATARAIADVVEAERDPQPAPVTWNGDALRARLGAMSAAGRPASDTATAHYVQAAAFLDRAAQYTRVAAVNAAALNDGRARPAPALVPDAAEEIEPVSPFALLRSVLTWDSVILRYALRVAVVTSAAVALTEGLGIKRGYWVTITIIVILQPYSGATTNRALQRVIGTVLGGLLTAALGALFHDPRAILVLAFVFAAACVALMPLSYAAYSVFLTPTFVLLAEAGAGDWHLARVRVLNTLLGGALALLGARVLWPSPEWSRLPSYLAAAARANRDYLRCVVALFEDRSEEAGRTIRAARRRVGLAAVNAEESFQRLLGEHPGETDELTAAMTFLIYTRRFSASTAALALARYAADAPPAASLEPFVATAERVLDDLVSSLEEDRQPLALPPFLGEEVAGPVLPPLFQARVERLRRQLRMLHDAVERWSARSAAGSAQRAATPARAADRVPA